MDFQLAFYLVVLQLLICPIQAAESEEAGESFCGAEVCGNVTIPFPFGIKTGCYTDSSFRVTCNDTPNGKRPFISRLNLELLGPSLSSGTILINNPVTYLNCIDKNGAAAASSSVDLTGTPFFFPSYSNSFGSVGCGNLARIFRNQTDSIAGCIQPICGVGASESGCSVDIPRNLTSYTVSMTEMYPAGNDDNKRCASAFVFDMFSYDTNYPLPSAINIETTHVAAILAWNSVKCDSEVYQGPRTVPCKSNSKEKCGDVDIQYPFGINDGYMNDWFRVTCIKTVDGPRPFIKSINLELIEVSFFDGSVLVNHPVTYSTCGKNDNNGISVNLTSSPFYFSTTENLFWSSGCDNLVTIFGNQTDHLIGGCLQPSCKVKNETSTDVSCTTTIPLILSSFSVNMTRIDSGSSSKRSCESASIIDRSSFAYAILDVRKETQVATRLQWGVPKFGLCEMNGGSNTSCSSDGKYCWSRLSSSHLCVCGMESGSGLYTTDVCEGRKCENSRYKYCQMLCLNSPGNYCSSECPQGYEYISTNLRCEPKKIRSSGLTKRIRNLIIIIGCSTSIGTLFLLLGTWRMYKVLKRRKNVKLKQKYFKRNGGLLLQQHWSSNEGNVEKIKLFTSKELEKATDYYNENRILGQGGQGTVYKGMLTDGSIVAIKKSKVVEKKKIDEKKVEQFINEVIILSQINHRNVVKLLGCCLEAEVPLLVYEFIPNGTLSQLIHYQNEDFPLTWEMRLRIAIEIANALSYLHSAASAPIYHRDIKSSNILLDDRYRAKVSDFGTSRSIALEQTHLTTRVQGTFGYMDPEYFRSSQFTEKSDVYSFGVVLVELLTGQKPISSKQSEEVRSLVAFFLASMQENSLFDILDPKVVSGGPEEESVAVAKLAKRCLNLIGKKRPTMKQVTMELELIRASKVGNAIQESSGEESDTDDVIEPWVIPSCSTSRSTITGSVTLP